MKKLILPLLLLSGGLAQAQQPFNYIIKGKLGTISAPAKMYLVRGSSVLDSAMVKNGAFEIKGTAAEPVMAELLLRQKGRPANLRGTRAQTLMFLEPGTIVVASPDSLTHATIKGGPINADNLRLNQALKPVFASMDAYGAELQKASAQQQQDPAFGEQVQAKFTSFNKQIAAAQHAFIKANPASWASLYALTAIQMIEPPYEEVAPLYAALSPELKSSAAGREYGARLAGMKGVMAGTQAPDFTQPTPSGKMVSLRDYRGKYVLVDFWASWCGPCRQENPAVVKAYNEYKGRNFDVLSISVDDEKGRAKWVKAIADDQLPWTQVSDLKGLENAAARLYHVTGVPQNFLIDPNGKILAVNLKGAALREALAQYVK